MGLLAGAYDGWPVISTMEVFIASCRSV